MDVNSINQNRKCSLKVCLKLASLSCMRGKVLFERTECQQPVEELLPYLISIKYQEREKESGKEY